MIASGFSKDSFKVNLELFSKLHLVESSFLISNLAPGLSVPIPTFPDEDIAKCSEDVEPSFIIFTSLSKLLFQ